jgi:hypothetical protein
LVKKILTDLCTSEDNVPFPSEHAARITEPMPSNSAIYARKNIAMGIDIIMQKAKGDLGASMKIQAYRFSKNVFTPDEAKNWLKTHNIKYTLFEPAGAPETQENRKDIIDRITHELAGAIVR